MAVLRLVFNVVGGGSKALSVRNADEAADPELIQNFATAVLTYSPNVLPFSPTAFVGAEYVVTVPVEFPEVFG